MKLSISARIAEEEHVKDRTAISFEELARLASAIGYEGLCIRPSQATVNTPDEEIGNMRRIMDRYGLRPSMVTLDPVIAANTPEAGQPQRHFDRHVDVAEMLGADLIRVAIKNEDDIVWTRHACDQAAERGIRVQHQTHSDSLLETVDQCLDVVRRVGRSNFGITVEPGNLVICGQDYGPEAIQRLGPHVFNVYLQNLRLSETGSSSVMTLDGEVHYDRLVVGEEGGIDFERFFEGLRSIDYDGFVTTHQPAMEGMSVGELAQTMFERLDKLR